MLDHLAHLRQYLETQVLSQRAAVLIIESWRDNTLLITQPAISGIAGVLNWISIPFQSVVSTGTIFGDTGSQYHTINTFINSATCQKTTTLLPQVTNL